MNRSDHEDALRRHLSIEHDTVIVAPLDEMIATHDEFHAKEHAMSERAFVMRIADNEDRARLIELGKDLDIPVPTTTTLSLDASELQRLRAGFVRYTKADEDLYNKLRRAEMRLQERLGT